MTKIKTQIHNLKKQLINKKPHYTKEFLKGTTEDELYMLMEDRRGKGYDSDFVKFLYNKFNLGVDEETGKKKRRKRKSAN